MGESYFDAEFAGRGVRALAERLGEGGFGKTYVIRAGDGNELGVAKAFDGPSGKALRDSEFHRLSAIHARGEGMANYCPVPIVKGSVLSDGAAPLPAFLMTRMPGVPLDRFLTEKGCLTAVERAALALAMIEPLKALHSITGEDDHAVRFEDNMMHGDLKPDNILISERRDSSGEGLFKASLIDFGTARESSSNNPRAKSFTPTYKLLSLPIGLQGKYGAPERFRARSVMGYFLPGAGLATGKSDVWSYAMLILSSFNPEVFERYRDLLEGYIDRLDYGAQCWDALSNGIEKEANGIVRHLLKADKMMWETVSEERRSADFVVDRALNGVIVRCLNSKPADRPQSKQIYDFLKNALWNVALKSKEDPGIWKKWDEPFLGRVLDERLGTFQCDILGEQRNCEGHPQASNPRVTPAYAGVLNSEGREEDAEDDVLTQSRKGRSSSWADRHRILFSLMASMPGLSLPFFIWGRLADGETVHYDAPMLGVGAALVAIGVFALAAARGRGAARSSAAIAVALALCLALPGAAVWLPATLGGSNAQYSLAMGFEKRGDFHGAFSRYELSAAAGNPFACMAIGQYYEYGIDPVEEDSEAADAYYRQAREFGYE